jgi:hypothetical protein
MQDGALHVVNKAHELCKHDEIGRFSINLPGQYPRHKRRCLRQRVVAAAGAPAQVIGIAFMYTVVIGQLSCRQASSSASELRLTVYYTYNLKASASYPYVPSYRDTDAYCMLLPSRQKCNRM